jgi:CelD/BcsL family acetyltransferase involved in cellulose biosynthesis
MGSTGAEIILESTPCGSEAAAFEAATLPLEELCADGALVRSWRRLEAAGSLPTQGHAFASALAEAMLVGTRVEVICVRDSDGLAAVAPFCGKAGFFARWRMVGPQEVWEPADALFRDGQAARLLAEAIASDPRPLQMDRMPVGSPMIGELRSALKGNGLMWIRPATPTPTIALEAGWEDPASQFNSRRRSDFRRAARKASELGEVAFEMLAPEPHEFDALFDEAIAVEVESWKREAGTALAVNRPQQDFFRRFFRSACERGQLRIAFMRIGGKAVAMQMALESLGRYWLFKIGFDEAYGRCSPGALLMLHTIGWAADRGLRSYELLGYSEAWIADLWTRDQQDYVRVRLYPFTLRGMVALAADGLDWLRKRVAAAKS